MASMSTLGAALAAVPAGLRTGAMESSVKSCPAPSTVFMGQNKAASVSTRRYNSVVARVSASKQVGYIIMYLVDYSPSISIVKWQTICRIRNVLDSLYCKHAPS